VTTAAVVVLTVERFRGRYEGPAELRAACVGQYAAAVHALN
jgi:hypothetical protein